MSIIKSGDTTCIMHVCKDVIEVAEVAAIMFDTYDSKVWLNLTNGIEAAPYLESIYMPYDFCRFKSCSFEQGRWEDAVSSMPDDMLMRLALGQRQTIIDFGANKACSRAMYQGVPIALRRIALSWGFNVDDKMWIFNRSGKPIQCDRCFAKNSMIIDKKQHARLKYFSKYVTDNTKPLTIDLICAPTVHDGDYGFYTKRIV